MACLEPISLIGARGAGASLPQSEAAHRQAGVSANKEDNVTRGVGRRGIPKGGGAGLAALGAAATTGAVMSAREAAAQ